MLPDHPSPHAPKVLFFITSYLILPFLLDAQGTMKEVDDFGKNPGWLKAFYHPPEDSGSGKKPLLVALHGCNQTGAGLAKHAGWNELADEHGFYVLYPQQRVINNMSKCFNWFRNKDMETDRGEVASIRNMIGHMSRNFPIDTSRIYITGVSAGAAMGVAAMACYPEVFQGGAILAGGPYKIAANPYSAFYIMNWSKEMEPEEWEELVKEEYEEGLPASFPKMVILHGEEDRVLDFKNAGELMEQWTEINNIDQEPDVEDHKFQGNRDISRLEYHDEAKEPIVILYEIDDLGHSIPVDPGDSTHQGGATGLFAKDIDWFSSYWMARDLGLIDH